MPDLLWWVQVIGGFASLLLAVGAIVGAAYSMIRGMPRWLRRVLGYDDLSHNVHHIEDKIDKLLIDHRLSQHAHLQQAQAFNELKETVCEEHDIPEGGRPPDMDTDAMERELMDRDEPDFYRNASPASDDEAG